MKKFLTFILVLAMVMSVTSFAMAYEGDGSESNPYLIKDLADLETLRNEVNAGQNYAGKYFKLAASIDMSSVNWEPIGNIKYNNTYAPADPSKVFSGVFDGNGKVLSNLKIEKYLSGGADADANLGLFGIIGEGAVVKNLTITNVDIDTDGRNVGALAGVAHKATIDNITVNGNIQIKGGNNVCGVIAMTRYFDVSVTNITVSGNDSSAITGNNIVAGIFAEIAPNGSNQTFSNLSVENVAITGVGGVGGIVGLLTNGAMSNVSVKNVALTGKTEYQGDPMGRIRLGSVVGLLGSGKDTYSTVSGVTVQNVTGKNLDGDAVTLPDVGANYTGSVGNATEAKVGDKYYAKLDKAVEAAQDGDTITLLADCSGNGIVFPEGKFTSGLTIDFDGFTYTVDADPLAGSEGTKTQAFQILKNNTVTLKGGTLTSSKAKMLIQNYANLTLDGMTLNGENLADPAGGKYVLSNNSGRVSIKDTTINAASDGVAFDVCKYSSYTEPTVTVSGNSKINGKIEVTTTAQTNLQISGGTFSVEPKAEWIVFGKVAAKSGDKWVIKALDPGSLETKPAEGNVMSGAIDTGAMDDKEVKEIFAAVVKEEEKGKDVDIVLEVKALDENTIPTEVAKAIENKVDEEDELVGYLDINLLKYVDYVKDENITQLSKPIPITIELEEVVEGRTYYIIRVHDGVAERIDGTLNGNKFTFYTDRFSTYALASEKASTGSSNTSTGNGISVKYNGGNSFSTSNPAVPTGVEIDGVPVTFNGTGSNFTVGCISSDAKWVTVRWNSTTVTTNFTPDGLVECANIGIPKTGDMPFWAAVAAFFGF